MRPLSAICATGCLYGFSSLSMGCWDSQSHTAAVFVLLHAKQPREVLFIFAEFDQGSMQTKKIM